MCTDRGKLCKCSAMTGLLQSSRNSAGVVSKSTAPLRLRRVSSLCLRSLVNNLKLISLCDFEIVKKFKLLPQGFQKPGISEFKREFWKDARNFTKERDGMILILSKM